jgi:hypothetical protein
MASTRSLRGCVPSFATMVRNMPCCCSSDGYGVDLGTTPPSISRRVTHGAMVVMVHSAALCQSIEQLEHSGKAYDMEQPNGWRGLRGGGFGCCSTHVPCYVTASQSQLPPQPWLIGARGRQNVLFHRSALHKHEFGHQKQGSSHSREKSSDLR